MGSRALDYRAFKAQVKEVLANLLKTIYYTIKVLVVSSKRRIGISYILEVHNIIHSLRLSCVIYCVLRGRLAKTSFTWALKAR